MIAPVNAARGIALAAGAAALLVLATPLAASAAVPDYSTVATLPGADFSVAVNAVTNTVYIASYSNSTLSIVDGATNTVTVTVPVGPLPYAVAVNAATGLVYTANRGDNTLGVYSGTTGAAVGSPIETGASPYALAVNPVTNRIYVANRDDGTVQIIDGATGTSIGLLDVGYGPQSVAIDTARNLVYVTGQGSIVVIDGATGTLLPPVTAADGSNPSYVAVNSTTNTLYTTNQTDPSSMSVIDLSTGTLTATIPVGDGQLQSIAVNETNNTVAIVGYFNNVVSLLDGATNEVTRITLTSINPDSSSITFVAFNQVTGNLYVTEANNGTLTVLSAPAAITPATPATPAVSALAATGTDITIVVASGLLLLLAGLVMALNRRTVRRAV